MKNCDDATKVVLLCDESYALATAVATFTMISHKDAETTLDISILALGLSEKQKEIFTISHDESVSISVIDIIPEFFQDSDREKDLFSVSFFTYLKYKLPDLLANHDKILYIDSDVIVKGDLFPIFEIDLHNNYAAAALDLEKTKGTEEAFNLGVLLLNLKKMREDNISDKLIDTQIDQDIFSSVLSGRIQNLPVEYNLLTSVFSNIQRKNSLDSFNEIHETHYETLAQLIDEGKIIHFSEKRKPWLSASTMASDEWYAHYLAFSRQNPKYLNALEKTYTVLPNTNAKISKPCKVSVIIPVYNVERYLDESLQSILDQTLKDIEIICINDGSTDHSMHILQKYADMDCRITIIDQENQGLSATRNHGFEVSTGKYVYFFDSDDLLSSNALELLYNQATSSKSEIVLFDANAFYENEELKNAHSGYETFYKKKNNYDEVYEGADLFALMVRNREYSQSACLQFFDRSFLCKQDVRFYPGILHEDNLFSLQVILLASRVTHLKMDLFTRRVRANSTMTLPATYKNFVGYFSCVVIGTKFLMENMDRISEKGYVVATQRINLLTESSARCLQKLANEERYQPLFLDPTEKLIANICYNSVIHKLKSMEDQKLIRALRKELRGIKNSVSYKVGRFFTKLPRGMRVFLKKARKSDRDCSGRQKFEKDKA